MNERLVFGYGAGRADVSAARTAAPDVRPAAASPEPAAPARSRPERRDWAFVGLLAFTAVLYFRPQDQIPGLGAVPFAELSALFGLTAMLIGRMSRGLPFTRITPELIGVTALGVAVLATAPFSIWPGGAVATFTDTFAKVMLIYLLMTNTLLSFERIARFNAVIVLATGYLATRALFDYARGINVIENGRIQGAVGGMFQNPNDMALNMVAVLPLALLVGLRARTSWGRLGAGFLGVMMIGAVIVSHSRGGFVGLAVMTLILGLQLARRRPAAVGGLALILLFSLPLAPSSYWERVSSITDDSRDATGSREARRILLLEAWETFLAFPVHGVGAGLFPAYNPPGRSETWRETHNVLLQVASEMGLIGLAPFLYLLWRAATAGRRTRRLVRRAANPDPPRPWQARPPAMPVLTRPEADAIEAHAAAVTAAFVGWFVCALFASVAYSWTFYYLLALAAAPHGILAGLLTQRTRPRARVEALRTAEAGA